MARIEGDDVELLKAWIMSKAESNSDAEPDVLADYVIALLNNEHGADDGLVGVLSTELDVFVHDPASFAQEVVKCVMERSFVPAEQGKLQEERSFASEYGERDFPPGQSKQQAQGKSRGIEDLISKTVVPNSTEIVVTHLPSDKLDSSKLREFFSRFGDVHNVVVDTSLRAAVLQFGDHRSAKKAWSSPQPIFDNRFIKVHFRREHEPEPAEKPLNMEEFKQQQLLKQRQFEEKRIKRLEHDAKLKQVIELKEKMLEGFEAQLKSLEEELIAHPENEVQIRAKVEQIQIKMVQEGITPHAIDEDKARLEGRHAFPAITRGSSHSRGRGRGGYTGFSPYTRPHSLAGPNRKLDLRTKTLVIKGLSDPDDEGFQRALGVFGHQYVSESSKRDDDSIKVTFVDRHYAERFLQEKVELDGRPPLEMHWDETARLTRPMSPADTNTC